MALLTCKNIAVGYDGKTVLSNLSFEVNSGDYLCIIGENGCGKSTLMKSILGLKSISDGDIFTGDGLSQKQIGYLPQQTVVQKDFPASVWEIVLSGCINKKGFHPFYTKSDKALAKRNMEQMGITDLSHRCYRELSGGQQQRVLLARALCASEKLLVLDEPVSGLDPNVTAQMYELIYNLHKQGITVIMITHDMDCVQKYATHILHIGKEVFFGTAEEYIKNNPIFLNDFKGGGENA